MGHAIEWSGGAGKALSGPDAGSETIKCETRSSEWHGGDNIRLQSKATEKYYETILEELRELEVKKSKEVLLLVQNSTFETISK